MTTSLDFKGTRWYKCDLHLHTTASNCFQDRNVTPEQWVKKAIARGLNCVAVTDHNTGNMVDKIKSAASGTCLTVFPGVEITCDTSKVHLLVIFDVSKSTSDVNDFLIRCEIPRKSFADKLASTTQGIFEIVERANRVGAIVIPAHIDEYNGLGKISNANLKLLYQLDYINAVQLIHNEFTELSLQTNDNEALRNTLNDYYNNPSIVIDYATMAEWHRPVKLAISNNLALTTFSDNPHEDKNPKHGLEGIGSRYTWIKMNDTPTLEGLRQALLLPDFRIKNDIISPIRPYKSPELWIKSITITDTTLTEDGIPLKIDFSPQLTSIIGGRGSGKSSIIRFIRGLFNRTTDIADLIEIITDHRDFYKRFDTRTKKGVLKDNSRIEIEFIRNDILHKITASNIYSSINQSITISKFDIDADNWVLENADGYIDFFLYEQYSQKQIYEIAQEPNSLRERIDQSIPEIGVLISEREIIKKSYFEKAATIRTIQQQISNKGILQTEIKDLADRIKLFQQSGIAKLLTDKEEFTAQQDKLNKFVNKILNKKNEIEELIDQMEMSNIDYASFKKQHSDEIKPLSKIVIDGYKTVIKQVEDSKRTVNTLKDDFEAAIINTSWKKDFDKNIEEFNEKRIELEKIGVDDISNFEKLTDTKAQKIDELEKIILIENSLNLEIGKKQALQEKYLQFSKNLTAMRETYVETLLQDDKIKISIKQFRNETDFIQKLRAILHRDTTHSVDIDALTKICFSGKVEQKIIEVREVFYKLKKGIKVQGITGYLENLVNGMTDTQMDEIDLLLPEDEIDIKYMPSGSTEYKPLTTASAGQKTTAILTVVLSQGNIPLILDQPEDDLDNRLVYDLIVDRLKQAKESRQIIVITHNANIPVNGDAEYIVSMDSDSKMLRICCEGTIEIPIIKKEICDVMEGSEQAFDMRAKRYKQIGQ